MRGRYPHSRVWCGIWRFLVNKSIKLLGLFFGMLAVLPCSKISAMNPEYAKQLAERRNRFIQRDAQRQVVVEQTKQEIQEQLNFIASIESDIKDFTRGLTDAQSYEAIFTLLGNIITQLEKKINDCSIIDLRTSTHAAVVQAVEALRAHMLTIVQAVQNSDPLASEILVLENASYLQQFEMQLQRIAMLLDYQHTGSFLAIDMIIEGDEEFAENLQVSEFQNAHDFGINNNNNVIGDDDFIFDNNEVMSEEVGVNQPAQNEKKRKIILVDEQLYDNGTKKQKLDNQQVVNDNNIIELDEQVMTVNYRENPDLTLAEEWMKSHPEVAPDPDINYLSEGSDQYLGMWGHIPHYIAQCVEEFLCKTYKLRCNDRIRFGPWAETPLIYAIKNHFFEIANLLICAGADPNLSDIKFSLPLETAIITCQHKRLRSLAIALVKTLINSGAAINPKRKTGEYDACTPLIKAVQNDDIEIINLLIDLGAIINLECARDPELIPLHIAVKSKNKEVAKILLEKGARVNKRDVYGSTALHLAAQNNDLHMIELLLKNGAKPNKLAQHDCTALHIAAKYGFFKLYHLLIEYGADDSLLDEENKTPNDYFLDRWISNYKFSISQEVRRARRNK